MIPWTCSRCGEGQVAFRSIPEDRLCNACNDSWQTARAFTEADAGIPQLFRGLTRETWAVHFRRPWPEALKNWPPRQGAHPLSPIPGGEGRGEGERDQTEGERDQPYPTWLALWGPTGTGKTGLATVLLAEHLRTGRRGRWISGPELFRRLQRDFHAAEDVLAPLLVTSLLVLDEPLVSTAADWYLDRLVLITRTRDESCLPTIVTSQLLPELLRNPTSATPPPLLSRWLSGLHIRTGGTDARLRKASR